MSLRKRKFFFTLACLILTMAFSACRNADFVGNSYQTGDSIIIEFQVLNTAQTQEIDLKSGDTVRFDVACESGRIDMVFGLKDASPDYRGNAMESGSFAVTVHEDGRYIWTVTGSKATGSVRLTKPE